MWYIKKYHLELLFLSLILLLKPLIFCVPPDPVTDLKVSEVHFRQVKLQWTVPYSVEPVSFYQIRISSFLTLSNETEWQTNSSVTTFPYRIVISTSGVDSGVVVSYNVTGLTNGVVYYFAIKTSTCIADVDDTSLWSGLQTGGNYFERYAIPQNFTPQQFAHIWPVSRIVVTSQTVIPFDWEDAVDPDLSYGDSLKYELYWSTISTLQTQTPPDLTSANVIFNLTTSYIKLPVSYFLDNTTYYWRLKVVDSENLSTWSLGSLLGKESVFIMNHTPEAPSNITLLSPTNISTITTATGIFFDWIEVSDPDPQDVVKYYLYISSQGQNIGFVLQVGDITWSSYTVSSIFDGAVENTTYWWYVVARDMFNLESFSPTWYFIVNNFEEPPEQNFLISPGTTIFSPLLPSNEQHIVFTLYPTFYWTVSHDPDCYNTIFYQVLISSYSDMPSELNSIFYTVDPVFTTFYCLTQQVLQDKTTYFWHVRIWDEPYSGYAVYSSTVYWFYTCVENLPPTAAQLLFPANGSTTSYFYSELKWQPGTDYGFNAKVSSQCLIYWTDNDTITVSGLLPSTSFYIVQQKLKNNTTYYWQVITYDNGYPPPQKFSSSDIYNFYVFNSPPLSFDLLSPANGSIIDSSNIQLFWTNSVDIDNEPVLYKVVYSTDNFKTFYSSAGISGTNFLLQNLMDNTTYSWYVFAYDYWGHTTGASATFYFVVDNIPSSPTVFNLLLPENNFISRIPSATFYWEASFDPDPYDAISYNLIISTVETFDVIKFSTNIVITQFYLAQDVLDINTTYYWQVVAVSSRTGVTTAQNSPFVLFIYNTKPTKPLLAYPQDRKIVNSSTTILQWSMSVDLENDYFWYELYYSSDNRSSWVKIILPQQQNSFELSNLIDDTTYYWYLVVVDTYMNINISDEFVFYTQYFNQPPTQPQIIQPYNSEIVNLPYTISWTTSTDSDIFNSVIYRLQISTENSFSSVIIEKLQEDTNFVLSANIQPGSYYIRILAEDNLGSVSTSTVINFVIPYYTVENYAPQNNALVFQLPVIFMFSKVEPVVATDTIKYKLIISTSADFIYRQEILLFNTFYTLSTPPLYPATYFWYITAYDSYNRFAQSEVWRFFVPQDYPPAPKNVLVSTSTLGLIISWEKITLENFWMYKIYRGYEIDKVDYLVTVTTDTIYIDEKGLYRDYFYTVKTVNMFGVESVDNIYIAVKQGKQTNFYFSEDGNIFVAIDKEEHIDYIYIERKKDEENENVKFVYEIKSEPYITQTNNFFEIQFTVEEKNCFIEYYDGYQWINIPYEQQYNKLVIKTRYFGKYRVVEKKDTVSTKKLTIIGCSPQKRIITPNNDGKNDYIEFQYDVDKLLYGEIYDIKLRKICELKRRDKNILYFDGRDNEGKLLPAGVYIYNIHVKPTGESFTDTIVIKY